MTTPAGKADAPISLSTARRAMRNVKAEMARRGLVQKDLAEILGVSQQAVSDRVNDKTPLSLADLDALAIRFGMSVTELITGERKPDPASPIRIDWIHRDQRHRSQGLNHLRLLSESPEREHAPLRELEHAA